MKLVNTPYDDVFRTLLNDCSNLIIPVINEVFGESYAGDEHIIFSPNEHFLNKQDGDENERVTDTNFKIVGTEVKKYHWECQSSADSSMLVRFFEYDTQIALDEGEIRENILTVTLPHSAVLFLRYDTSTPDYMKIEIITPGGSVSYNIPVMKSQLYTIEEIFEKKLLFLIPFYIFSYESRFEEYNKDMDRLNALKVEYGHIICGLEELMNAGKISEYIKCTIIDMSNKVLGHIAQKYENVKEGVKSVMGGKVLDYEAKRIKNEGKLEGRLEGRLEGKMEMLFDLVNDNLLSIRDAAFRAKLTEEAFKEKMQSYNS